MSGTPPPYPLEPTIGGPRNQQQQSPLTGGSNNLNNNALAASSAGRLRLPPPLPPVKGTTPVRPQPVLGALSAPNRPPMGRLTPLRRTGESAEGPDIGRRSPPPRLPISGTTPRLGEPHTVPSNGNGNDPDAGDANGFHTPGNPLTPRAHQPKTQQSPPKKQLDRVGTPSVRSNRTAPPMSNSGAFTRSVPSGEETVEELCPLQTQTRPVERFFVEFNPKSGNVGTVGRVDADDDEVLFDRLGEYTDDDSFFSSGSSVLEEDPRRLQRDPLRGRAVRSVYETLNLRALTGGRVPQELEDEERNSAGWMYQVHQRAIALHHSSFFVFPPGMTARVVVYNVMHHWLMEFLIILLILGYSIFTASWARHTTPELEKPDFMIFADVFYTVLYGIEIVVRLFASGFILHPRAYFRSPWHWLDTAVFVLMVMNCTGWKQLWNFTAFRLIRVIKSCTYIPMPVRMKLLAKSLLRSTNKLFYASVILVYALFFFALIGLQLFRGVLHYRCVNTITGESNGELCRPEASGKQWLYMGHVCPSNYICTAGEFTNPHYDFRSFDDIGHAFLSTFQIMSFQGWTELLKETNETVNVAVILYYAFTILFCAWFIPSLYLGVFIEKIEKTSRLFVQKQLQLFDSMLLEQRQRLNAAIKLRDFVERDEQGKLRSNPLDMLRYDGYSQPRHSRVESSNGALVPTPSSHSISTDREVCNPVVKKRTKWTDEQRVQLHLSLTRQRDIAEQAERKRRMVVKGGQNGSTGADRGGGDSRSSNNNRANPSGSRLTTANATVGGDFALGGRVGMVQHHPLTYTIGAAHGTNLPLAVRLENEEEQLKFLKQYQYPLEDESLNSIGAGNGNGIRNGVPNNTARPPLASASRHPGGNNRVDETRGSILATRESAGVIPSRHSLPRPCSATSRPLSAHNEASPLGVHGSAALPSEVQQEVLINDPEGGDFRYATTCAQRWAIVRNILHMFTEGYPRILTQYLWEHKRMQHRFGLTPLNYVNKYEEAALRKLRQRRMRQGKGFFQRNDGGIDDYDDEDDEENDVYREMGGMPGKARKGTDVETLSPIRMAKNIVENAPITIFNVVMLCLVFANGVFNASRHYEQPEYWDDGLFIAGVCFTALFMLEHIIRIIALGPGPFIWNFCNVLCLVVTIIGFFELGFGRSNAITVLNWVQFLRLLRVAPFEPMRRVARVLVLGFQDIVYALVFFSVYMFMWILIGMSFFGSRTGHLTRNDDYSTLGDFDTFSHATFAVAQAFSYTREEWLYMSWDGMRARGGYTILYFIAVVGVAIIFRYFFISVFTWAWQREEEFDDYALDGANGAAARSQGGPRLRWFDFTVWRSFKHIHGGFERRDVAPDEVYHLNQDMRRQLRIAEAKERFSRQSLPQRSYSTDHRQLSSNSINAGTTGVPLNTASMIPPVVMVPQFVNVGGQLQRQISMPSEFDEERRPPVNAPISQFQAENAQLRFARRYSAVPATAYNQGAQDEPSGTHSPPFMSTPSDVGLQESNAFLGELGARLDDSHHHAGGQPTNGVGSRSASGAPRDRRSSVTGHFATLDYERPAPRRGEQGKEIGGNRMHPIEDEDNMGGRVYEHILVPGPRLRYKHVMVGRRRRVFERCLDCNTHKQMPLRAPPNVQQRTADELHAEHCHMAAVRSSRQLVLNAILGYVRLQKELAVPPTREAVETVLGQAWSCGMLLFETVEYLSCADIEAREYRTWDRALEALQLQQWLIGLHVGEEQVGRATLAYILAHQKIQERDATLKSFKRSWRDRSCFILSPGNPIRSAVTSFVQSALFEWIILAVIYAASLCLCFYDPRDKDRSSNKYLVLYVFDIIFSIIFAIEMVLKWISMGVVLDVHVAYFWHRWNIFDCFITIVSLVGIASKFSYLRYLKAMRCFRILGPMRHCTFNKELSKLAVTMWDCVPTMANVLLLCLLNYIVWSILAVRLFMGVTHSCANVTIVNRTECELGGDVWQGPQRNFDNFYESLLTMFEVSTGSKWLDTIYSGVNGWSTSFAPIQDSHQAKGLFFIAYYYVSHLVLFSLFVASMIYCYLLAKNAGEGVMGITLEHQLWIRMQRMILRLTPRLQLVPMGNAISRFLHRVVTHRAFELVMACVLFFNIITMSLYWHKDSQKQEDVLDIFGFVWVALFTVEVIMRLLAHGSRAFTRWSFCLNAFVVVLSYLQIILNTTDNHKVPFDVNVLRLLHFGRLLTLMEFFLPIRTHLRLLHKVLLLAAPALVNVTLILLMAIFVFSILGMHLIGPVIPSDSSYIDGKYDNFLTFPNALIMTFRLATLEGWVSMLRASVSDGNVCSQPDCGTTNWAPVFYVPIVICFALMIISLYVAVVVDHYVTVVRMNASVTRIQDLKRFRELWSARDPNATLVLRTKQLPELLEALRPPLGLTSRHNRVELLRLLREYDIPDHNGRVHYHEVLLPLARRVLAMAFSEDEIDDGSTFEAVWRLSESSLRALPTVLVQNTHATAAQHFAASYLQAAYRRDKARRQHLEARAELWRESRAVCDELGLSYNKYGFGSTLLKDEDPRQEAALRGISIEGQEVGKKATGRSTPSKTPSENDSYSPAAAARLPGVYQPAIDEKEKRFGPDVPNAMRRHETRSDKLRRKEEERQQQSMDSPMSMPPGHRSSSQRLHSSDYQPPLGTDPSSWLDSEMSRRVSAPGTGPLSSQQAAPPPS
ncbi:putative calcium channel protein [Trypanosoma grayi]|uniref:putative calcium channel protein n=1 Tax=Trypanosoma grayi TaxID=71804 RepID=UPI0004F40D35|nr:putative calcium channel protein [Trypanosoma grayi]KEG15652.1 putative calcium channel protein [Trypanosoma grayi]